MRTVAQIRARRQVDIERVSGGALLPCPLGNLFELSQVGWRAKRNKTSACHVIKQGLGVRRFKRRYCPTGGGSTENCIKY